MSDIPEEHRTGARLQSDSWRLRRAALPIWAGIAAALVSPVLLAFGRHITETTRDLEAQTATARAALSHPTSSAAEAGIDFPSDATHLSDVSVILKAAQGNHVILGPLALQSEPGGTPGTAIKSLDFQVDSDYESLKAFLAQILGALPHAYLGELRIEQGAEGKSQRLAAGLKLSLVYREGTAGAAVAAQGGAQ